MVLQPLVKAAGVSPVACLCGFGIFIAVYSMVAHSIFTLLRWLYTQLISCTHCTLQPLAIIDQLSLENADWELSKGLFVPAHPHKL